MSNDIKHTYLSLVSKAQAAATAYRSGAEDSPLTDDQYDLLIENIESLGQKHGWTEHQSLLEVGDGVDVPKAGSAVTHKERMLSLAKVQSEEELVSFLKKMGLTDADYVVEPKLDGLAINASYVNGELVQLATRGNSQVGQDVTERGKNLTIKNLPHTIPSGGTYEVRGELYIARADFPAIQKARKAATGEEYSLDRNAVSGGIQAKVTQDLSYLILTFAAYDMVSINSPERIADEVSYRERGKFLKAEGFLPSTMMMPAAVDAADTVVEKVRLFGPEREALQAPTDGIVIKVDSLDVREEMGAGSRHPRWAVAYKYPATIVKTVFRDVIRSIGRTGAITYRAKLDKVLIDGSQVEFSTLNNATFINTLDLCIDDTVMVRKANDIIPEIMGVDYTQRAEGAVHYQAPTTCPVCEQEMDTKSSVIWRCTNITCRVLPTIVHAASRDALYIKGLSTSRVRLLVDSGLVKDVPDLYSLTVADLAKVSTGRVDSNGEAIVLGETVAETLYKEIQGSLKQPLNRILTSMNIRHLGRTMGRELASHFKTFDAVVSASRDEIAAVIVTGETKDSTKATTIFNELAERAELVQKYRQVPFEVFTQIVAANTTPQVLAGKSVTITGNIPGYGRVEAKELIERFGGKASSSVSARTTFVVAELDARDSSKAKKALDLNVPIFTPAEFFDMLGVS